jgi:hypothetical protein
LFISDLQFNWECLILSVIKLMRVWMLGLLFGSVCLGANDDSDFRCGAQNIASVFHAGVAAGVTKLQGSGSVEAAVRLLKVGVAGTGAFDGVVFEIPSGPEHDLENVSPYLSWNEKMSMLMYGSKAKEDVRLPDYAASLRNAQNLASVWSTGVASGAKILDIKSATEAVKILTDGGIHGEDLRVHFNIELKDEREVAAALEHLNWDEKTHLLTYIPQSDPKLSRHYEEPELVRERLERDLRERIEKLKKDVDRAFIQEPQKTVGCDPVANVAIARVEAMNLACAAFIQAEGRTKAALKWKGTPNVQERYALLSPFLAFAPREFDKYFPEGYEVEFPETLTPLWQLKLSRRAEVNY